jgi:antitoxin MazE
VQVAKWGNSLAVRLPKAVVDALGLKAGDEIEIIIADKGRFAVAKDRSREEALARLEQLKWRLPKGFKFDRNEANER